MTLDPARRLEVLRGWLSEAERQAGAAEGKRAHYASWTDNAESQKVAAQAGHQRDGWRERAEALSDAIKAVEQQGASPTRKCVYGEHDMRAKCPMLDDAYGATQPCEPEPKSSAESLQERVEALTSALGSAEKSLIFIAHDRVEDPWAIRAYAKSRATVAGRALHPHASHCNEEHEGACEPGDRPDAE